MLEREEVLRYFDTADAGLRADKAKLGEARRYADAAREADEDANCAKSSFLANMSHKLRPTFRP